MVRSAPRFLEFQAAAGDCDHSHACHREYTSADDPWGGDLAQRHPGDHRSLVPDVDLQIVPEATNETTQALLSERIGSRVDWPAEDGSGQLGRAGRVDLRRRLTTCRICR
ncbi:MAG: hypothetical protein O7A98_04995 [Acidobacteria bacterium]|nr:hypothetical protein [Acidobacteriota bacterium]